MEFPLPNCNSADGGESFPDERGNAVFAPKLLSSRSKWNSLFVIPALFKRRSLAECASRAIFCFCATMLRYYFLVDFPALVVTLAVFSLSYLGFQWKLLRYLLCYAAEGFPSSKAKVESYFPNRFLVLCIQIPATVAQCTVLQHLRTGLMEPYCF